MENDRNERVSAEKPNMGTAEPLLRAEHLKKYFKVKKKGLLHAVDDVSFYVGEGETLGIVGESGCGKSTVGNLVMRLLPKTAGALLPGNQCFPGLRRRQYASKKKDADYFPGPLFFLKSAKNH